MKINWKGNEPKVLYFNDLVLNDSFRIKTPYSKGAVYTKVCIDSLGLEAVKNTYGKFAQLELQTGKVFPPTSSPVERVEVQAHINEAIPSIYEDLPF